MHEQARRKGGKLPTKRILQAVKVWHEEILSAKLRGIEIDGEKNQSQVGWCDIRESTLNGKIVRRNNTEMRP